MKYIAIIETQDIQIEISIVFNIDLLRVSSVRDRQTNARHKLLGPSPRGRKSLNLTQLPTADFLLKFKISFSNIILTISSASHDHYMYP